MNPVGRFVLKPCIEYGNGGFAACCAQKNALADKNQSAAKASGKK